MRKSDVLCFSRKACRRRKYFQGSSLHQPEAEMEAVVRDHLHRLIACEGAVDQLADGRRHVDVVQDDDERHVRRAGLPIDPIGQVGKMKLQILRKEREQPVRTGNGQTRHTGRHESSLSPFRHLARLAVHVERDHDAVGDFAGAAVHQVLGQPGRQVALARPAGPRQDEAAVFEQQADVVLHHGFGNEGLEYQAVHTLLLQP
ncbi:hypothetical protein EYF80_013261 [Liparis tanakae]|uniref:Uncharacterized protein n=1 Tax=Liparis tanakae TaxID=230148 RepID=A0A4Z2IEP1_9TELE|nr:hypothetical protein EYF80_013261 [Liparis tanakae]